MHEEILKGIHQILKILFQIKLLSTRVALKYKKIEYPDAKGMFITSSPNIRSTPMEDLPWLTYFKKKAGAEAVQHWIEKSKNNEDYEVH
jgi:hypothetical protein